jgi:uncharacterized protein involved in exopolysaccharide biosynthesis
MQDENLKTEGKEISLKDIINFFKDNRKRIVFCGIIGLVISSVYVTIAPREYEATWQMQLAQLGNKNIEEPAALAARLRPAGMYPIGVQQHCGMTSVVDIDDNLNNKLEIKPVKDLPNIVQIKIRANSSEQAKQCAEALVTLIIAHQQGLIEESLAGRQEQMVQYQQALKEERRQLDKTAKTEQNIAYLAALDNLSWLRTRVDAIQEEILLSQMHPAKLMVPISAPGKPSSPNTKRILLLGILSGLMLGLLYAIGREGWRKVAE